MTDEKRINKHQEISSEKEKRQKLMATALKFATVLTTLGISGNVWGTIVNAEPVSVAQREISPKIPDRKFQTPLSPKQKAVGNLLQEAIKTQDVNSAIEKWAQKAELNREQVKALQQLTKEDLTKMANIREKLDLAADDFDAKGYFVF